jgi:flagellar protein FliL
MSSKKTVQADNTLVEDTPKKGGMFKKIIILTIAATTLVGAGVGAASYLGLGHQDGKAEEDPSRPKLVERSDDEAEPTEGEGGDAKDVPLKVGTVSVKSDRHKIDPKKFEITYFPIEQPFTSNLADGESFVQIGLSLSTYYDGRLIQNLKRQMIPIRSQVLTVLSTQNAEVLASPEGREMLQSQLTREINAVLRKKEGFGGIDNVYITQMVVQ